MRKLFLLFMFIAVSTFSQVVTWEPFYFTENDQVTVYFNAAEGSQGLKGYSGDVYAHTGVLISKSNAGSDWYAAPKWPDNDAKYKLTRVSGDLYKFVITPSVRDFYKNAKTDKPISSADKITHLAFVFRDASGSKTGKTKEGGDIFIQLESGLKIVRPSVQPLFVELNESVEILAVSSNTTDSIQVFSNGILVHTEKNDTLNFSISATSKEKYKIILKAFDNGSVFSADSFTFMVNPDIVKENPTENIIEGINYISDTEVILSLFAPGKNFVYVIGDFNNWEPDAAYFMNKTTNDSTFWLRISGLEPGKEYAYQYLVDGDLKIADPYTDKVLDPWNDKYIPSSVYPGLKPYPENKTDGIVSVLQTAQNEYVWKYDNYQKPAKESLVIYELLVRDFVSTHSYQTLIDTLSYLERLGVNAIELMPVNEFEGNESWGYNPSFYFAPDKYYGTKDKLKEFIDECHKRGIAVIIDMVLNHSYGQSPLVRLYWNSSLNRPSADNPWYNEESPNKQYSWGYDFNHESKQTQKFVDRVNNYWVNEYHVDGFRFDFTKGFTNTSGDGSGYDQSRINILKRMADKIWENDSSTYVILEHFAQNSEERELADYGMMLWGNSNYNYNEATMGYNQSGKSNFSWVSHKTRGWSKPHVVGYMESHDEERLMYKNLQYGNSTKDKSYNIKELNIALQRIKLAANFFLTIPGPKMIWQFGELGYDYSIDFNGRVGNKPIRWDYMNNINRYRVLETFRELNNLRNKYDVFKTNDFSLSVSSAMKSIQLHSDTLDVVIIGNFDIQKGDITLTMPKTGKWYDFWNVDSLEIASAQTTFTLEPGEYKLLSTKQLGKPDKEIVSGIEEDLGETNSPTGYKLYSNYPNPFNPSTIIRFSLPNTTKVKLEVYNLLGEKIATLVNKELATGVHQVNFKTSNLNLSSGVYFYRLETPSFTEVKKMLLLK